MRGIVRPRRPEASGRTLASADFDRSIADLWLFRSWLLSWSCRRRHRQRSSNAPPRKAVVARTRLDEFHRRVHRLLRSRRARYRRIVRRTALGQVATVAGALAFAPGVVFLVAGRTELFNENFADPTAAAVERPGYSAVPSPLRLWIVTLVFNVLGGCLLAVVFAVEGALPPESVEVPRVSRTGGSTARPIHDRCKGGVDWEARIDAPEHDGRLNGTQPRGAQDWSVKNPSPVRGTSRPSPFDGKTSPPSPI